MKNKLLILLLVPSAFIISCQPQQKAQSPEKSKVPGPEELIPAFESSLQEKILHKWYPNCLDFEYGGFITNYDYDWKPAANQPKMIVTQARLVWTAAKAAHFYPDDQRYQQAADHGFAFLRDKMWDQTYGGFYTLVDQKGMVMPNSEYGDRKTAYGNAFGLYALSAYYELTQSEEALELAKKSFQWLEAHSHDPENLGYFQYMSREGKPMFNTDNSESAYIRGFTYKDQNTSIHVLEALTEFYKVFPDNQVKTRLTEMLSLVRDTIANNTGYLHLFLTHDWKPISYRDSSNSVREANYGLDHVSFGHDIETAFLMLEASEALEKHEWDKTMAKAKKMVDHSLMRGWDSLHGGLYDQGYYFKGIDEITIIDYRKNWWSQSEAMNSCLLFATLYPEDEKYYAHFQKMWNYINTYLIDHEHGGWYSDGADTWPLTKIGSKGNIWKANYHDGRALMNCIQLLRKIKNQE